MGRGLSIASAVLLGVACVAATACNPPAPKDRAGILLFTGGGTPPETWRRGMNFRTPASVATAYAETLVRGPLTRTSLPHY